MTNPYKTLGVSPHTSQEEIRKVYRKLARQFHPDLNGGNKQAEERFKTISDAYSLIDTPEKRRLLRGPQRRVQPDPIVVQTYICTLNKSQYNRISGWMAQLAAMVGVQVTFTVQERKWYRSRMECEIQTKGRRFSVEAYWRTVRGSLS